ncbi:unnamed protein product [Linum trigynum]|uniref:Uncharacterized protein n=1 Tax=Linum trigynum TaxID=586398 RepID=A0AAV2DUT9_9ROSI
MFFSDGAKADRDRRIVDGFWVASAYLVGCLAWGRRIFIQVIGWTVSLWFIVVERCQLAYLGRKMLRRVFGYIVVSESLKNRSNQMMFHQVFGAKVTLCPLFLKMDKWEEGDAMLSDEG